VTLALAGSWVGHRPAAGEAELVAAQQPAGPWSPPAQLSACAARAPARVIFPSDSPSHATGPGAIVWSAVASCPGGPGARVAEIGVGDTPGESAAPALAPAGALVAGGAPRGQLAIAGTNPRNTHEALVIQGKAGGTFSALPRLRGPLALATGYLGDLALASGSAQGAPAPGGTALSVSIERFFASGFSPATPLDASSAPVQDLTAAMDYRGEVLAVWVQRGAIYTQLVRTNGTATRAQRVASVGADTHISALVSDDRRGIIAWSTQQSDETRVYLDRSALGVHFGAPELLEGFHDPHAMRAPAASPTLVRLSSESVMLAWASASNGRWVIRTTPIGLNGVGEINTIAAAGTDALLADLVAGPLDDALVLWTEPDGETGQTLYAAHGLNLYPPARSVFGEAELVAARAHLSGASAAFDPSNDAVVAAWQGEAGALEYSLRR
jgi:hypothetical protein